MAMSRFVRVSAIAAAALALSAPTAGAQTPLSEEEARKIGVDAHAYGYSLITSEITRVQMTNSGPWR